MPDLGVPFKRTDLGSETPRDFLKVAQQQQQQQALVCSQHQVPTRAVPVLTRGGGWGTEHGLGGDSF